LIYQDRKYKKSRLTETFVIQTLFVKTRMENKKKEVDRLNQSIKTCKKCRLHLTRTNALCGEGDLNARLMLIAQAPGDIEDREGRMFIGPSGKILDELLNEAGINRNEIYMTNLIKCRLPKNRRPKQSEIESCGCFLEEEIKLIGSDVIIPLGYYSSRYILKSITGRVFEHLRKALLD
jgi:uracil-DNA glycosylase family 4